MSNSRELSKLGSYVDVIDDVLIFDATNTSIEGVDISGLEAAVALNTVKVSNVTTDLTFSRSATTLTVVSSDGTDAILPSATLTLAGMMSAADKTSLTDHLSSSSNPHSVTKTQIGLGSVDNTSDAAKPVSTAQQTALNLKANLVSPALTGTPSAPTATTGTSTTQIATTAFVLTELAGIAQYSHPSDGVDLGIALTGATVISDVNVNAAGHVTGFATRNLTAANIGAQASGSYSLTSHNHSGVYQPIATVLTNTTASYTTAEQTKLSGIEAGATADQTKIDIDALNINADTLDGQHGAYYTNYVDTAITSILNAAPATLDTLNELAAALGDDPNFATTMTTALAGKVDDAQVLTNVPAGALFTDTNTWRPIDDIAVNGATTESISSNWAFDHTANSTAHPRDARNQIAGSYALTSHDHSGVYQPIDTVLTNTTASYTTAEQTKLSGIATSANNYVHPASHAISFITGLQTALDGKQPSGSYSLTSHNHSGVYQPIDTVLTNTTASYTTAEQTKLSGIATSANNYVHPTGDGNLHVPATSTTNNGKVLTAGATAGSLSWSDIPAYGLATSTVAGVVELASDTDQTVAANAVSATAGRTYGIQLNAANQMVVNVPWSDTNTTYTSASFNHDSLTGFVANEHIDWTTDQGATNIHANNYTHSHAYVTSLAGTANEVEVSASTGSVTVGLPNDVTITGTLSAASKSFLIPHPNKEGKKLRHGSLEGPENGVYIRGRLFGTDKIELPDFWKGLVDFDTITVQLTAKHNSANVKVGNITEESIEVVQSLWSKLFGNRIDCFYTVYAERNDIAKLIVEE